VTTSSLCVISDAANKADATRRAYAARWRDFVGWANRTASIFSRERRARAVGDRRASAHNSRRRQEPRRKTRPNKQAEREDSHARNNPGRREGCKGPMCRAERLGHGKSPKGPRPRRNSEARFVPAAIAISAVQDAAKAIYLW
jgi:hypothetical protein